jgi:predicted flavoprotein YhiN
VVLLEKTDRLGRKILASGNGRCNLLNDNLDETHYNNAAQTLVKSVFSRYGKAEIMDFFTGLGLKLYSQNGRIFPATNQAGSVLKVLEMEMQRLSIPIEYSFNCNALSSSQNSIVVSSEDGGKIVCRKPLSQEAAKAARHPAPMAVSIQLSHVWGIPS